MRESGAIISVFEYMRDSEISEFHGTSMLRHILIAHIQAAAIREDLNFMKSESLIKISVK